MGDEGVGDEEVGDEMGGDEGGGVCKKKVSTLARVMQRDLSFVTAM